MTMTTTDYNGWANRATWNVALWLNNDEGLYRTVCEYVRRYPDPSYDGLAHLLDKLIGPATPDGVRWFDSTIDTDALDETLASWLD